MYGLQIHLSLLLLHIPLWFHPCQGNHCQILQSLENKGVVVDGTDKAHLIIDGSTENSLECFELCCDTDDCVVAEFYPVLLPGQINNCFLFACNPLDSCKIEDQNDTLVQVFDKNNQTKHSSVSSTNHVTSTPQSEHQSPSIVPSTSMQATAKQEPEVPSRKMSSSTTPNNLSTKQMESSSKITTTSKPVKVSSAPTKTSSEIPISTNKSPSTQKPAESNDQVKNVSTTKVNTTTPLSSPVQTTHGSDISMKNITKPKTSNTVTHSNIDTSTKTTLSSVTHASASPSTTTVGHTSASSEESKMAVNTTTLAQNKSDSESTVMSTTKFQSRKPLLVTNNTTTAKISTTKSQNHEQTTELPLNKTSTVTHEEFTQALANTSDSITSAGPSSFPDTFTSSSKFHSPFTIQKITLSSNAIDSKTRFQSSTTFTKSNVISESQSPSSLAMQSIGTSKSNSHTPEITSPTVNQSNQFVQTFNEENLSATTNGLSQTGIQNITVYNQTSDQSYIVEEHSSNVLSVALIGALSFGIIFFLAVLALVFKRCFDSWQRRHYSRIDYLVNGMYN